MWLPPGRQVLEVRARDQGSARGEVLVPEDGGVVTLKGDLLKDQLKPLWFSPRDGGATEIGVTADSVAMRVWPTRCVPVSWLNW